jgi:hypothetical protein
MKEYPIHISDVRTFKSCRQLWDFTSPLRRNLTPKWPNRNLWGGTGVHVALGAYYDPANPFSAEHAQEAFDKWLIKAWYHLESQTLTDARWDEIFDTANLINRMLVHYFSWAPERDKFTVFGSEIPYRFPLPVFPGKHVYYEGKADGLVKWIDGEYWLLEHKTVAKYPDFSLLFIDEQCVSYQWGSQVDHRFEGRRPVGTIYTFLLKALPQKPAVLKNGGLSKAKSIRTTPEIYLEALREHGLPTTMYGDILQHLRSNPYDFFKRVRIRRQPDAMHIFGQRLIGTIAEMIDPLVHIVPSPNWFTCGNCAFRVPCMMVANGLSPDPILHANFKERQTTPTPPQEKQCRKCLKWLPIGEFYKNTQSKDGLQSWCKECKRTHRRHPKK